MNTHKSRSKLQKREIASIPLCVMLNTRTEIKLCNNQDGIICMLGVVQQGFVLVEMTELEMKTMRYIKTVVWARTVTFIVF